MALRWPDKDPDEQLDYTVDWSRYLDTLTIASVAWRFVQADGTESSSLSASDTFNGLTVNRITNTSTTATIVLSGGTANIDNKLICEITTSTSTKTNAAIVTKRVINLRVRERK
jgi:hypothetical protein